MLIKDPVTWEAVDNATDEIFFAVTDLLVCKGVNEEEAKDLLAEVFCDALNPILGPMGGPHYQEMTAKTKPIRDARDTQVAAQIAFARRILDASKPPPIQFPDSRQIVRVA